MGTYKETIGGKTHSQRYNRIVSEVNRSKAITDKFGTRVDGGLISTVITEYRELDSPQVTGLISGIQGTDKNLPFLVAGGTYNDALSGTAKAIIRHDGSVKFTDGEFIGIISALGGNIGLLDIDINGNVKLIDAVDTTLIRLLFSKSNIPTVDSILNSTQYGQTVSNSAVTYSTQGISMLPNTVSVTQNSSTLTFSGTIYVDAELDLPHGYVSGYALVEAILYKDGIEYVNLGGVGGYLDETNFIISDNYIINKSIIVGIGNYSVYVRRTFTNVINQVGGISNTSTLSWTFNKEVKRFEFGYNGFMGWYTNTHMYLTEDGGFDGQAPLNKWNAPGVLAAGSSTSGGTQSNVWGAKSNPAGITIITGGFRVPLSNMTHSSYVVQITPHTNTTFRIGTKTSTYFEIFGTGGFDYVVIGNNYQ